MGCRRLAFLLLLHGFLSEDAAAAGGSGAGGSSSSTVSRPVEACVSPSHAQHGTLSLRPVLRRLQ